MKLKRLFAIAFIVSASFAATQTAWAGHAGSPPHLTGVSPSSAPLGANPVIVTVTGTNMMSCMNGQGNVATSVSLLAQSPTGGWQVMQTDSWTATSVTGRVFPPHTNAGPVTVNTVAGCADGHYSYSDNSLNINLTAAPSISSISPSSTSAGGSGLTLTVNGSNFGPTAMVRWNGTNRTTTYVSSTQLTASITAADVCSIGSTSVTVSLYNVVSNATGFTISAPPAPTISGLSPASATAGSGGLTLTVNGANYPCGSTVKWNGSSRTTTRVSSSQLTASLIAADVATAGTATVTVTSGAGTSGVSTFTINNPAPILSSISPGSTTAPGTSFTLTLTGSGFVSGSSVRWNGSSRTTTYVSSTQLTASIPASDVTAAGTATVTVVNASPGGGTSGGQMFTINNPAPTLTSLSPTTTTAPGGAFTLTVNGSNFISGSTVRWNGSSRTTTYVSSTQLTGSIPASDVTAARTATVTVVNASPGGGTSGGQMFTVNNPAPTTTGISPSSTPPGEAGFTLTVSGTNFVNGSVVQWNGTNRTTTYVSSTQLTATITATDIVTGGTATVTVVNASPGGGTSGGQTFTIAYLPPTLSSLSVTSKPSGSGDTPLTVTGANLYNGQSTVMWNGTALATTYVSATQLAATIPTANLATPDTVTITVVNTPPGGGTSSGLTFVVLPVLQVGTLAQNGWTVEVPVTWPPAGTLADQSVNCGNVPTQTKTGPSISCVYTQAGTYTITGISTVGGTPNVQSPTAQVTIPLRVPTEATLTPTIDSRPASTGTSTYTLPVPLSVAATLTQPGGVGIIDPINIGPSTMTVQIEGGSQVNMTTTQADPLTYGATQTLAAAGTYTIRLQGTTVSGQPISASVTTTLTLATVSLQIGPLEQDGFAVRVPVSWPEGTVPVSIDCGTTTPQTFTGLSGQCIYTTAGAKTVIGRFTEPYHQTTVQTPAAVTIPLLVPSTGTLGFTVNGLSVSGTNASPFRFPASLSTAITIDRPEGVGIIDPLNLTTSRLAITRIGGTTSNRLITAGTDALNWSATGQFDGPDTYEIALNGQTISGGAVTGTVTLTVSQGSPVLILGNLVQDGFNVLMTVSWPDDLQDAIPLSINCGTLSTQLLTGTTGVCRYTSAGTLQVRGSFKSPETGAPTLQTAPQPVTIPLRVPTAADLAFTVNNVPTSGSSVTAYRFPAIVRTTVTLRLPEQIGVIDPLDLGPSRLNIGRDGGSTTAYRLSLGADQTLSGSLSAFDAAGSYTIGLNGQTVHGTAVTSSQTLTVSAAGVSLILGTLVQDGDQVATSVTWPDSVTPIAVNCGTSTLQTFTGQAGACSYRRPGSFQVTGTFRNPEDNGSLAAVPATVTIPAITPVNPQIALQVNGQPVAGAASTYRLPSNLKAVITVQRPEGIGVLDQLDTQNSILSIAPDGMAATRYRPVMRDNPLLATVDGEVRRTGPHTVTLQAKTLGGQALDATTTLMVELGKATLQADPPAQDGNAVIVPVRWTEGGPTGTINCGFASQIITSPTGYCRYTRAGSYQIVGLFPDPARGSTVLTDPIPVPIALLAPTQASLSVISVNSAGVSVGGGGEIPLFTTMQPQSYPVGVRLKVSFERPDGIGIVDLIDRSRSSLTATAASDGATPIPIALSLGSGPLELTALANLRNFPPDPADPGRWRYRFAFAGQAVGGSTYSAQAELAGSIGSVTPITLQVSRGAPAIPFAPATYQYSLTSARSATLSEPLTPTWTVAADGQAPTRTVQHSRITVTFEGPGTYQVQLAVQGPFSGTSIWSDTVTIPALPGLDAPTITVMAPEQNRPPAAYRFRVVTPPLPDRREKIGVPTWTAQGSAVTGPVLVTTFTTAGQHQVDVSVPTSYGRTLEAQTTVTVNPNQPPVGTVDCSRSSFRSAISKYILYCRATAADPDGRISGIRWVIPELQYERPDTTIATLERDEPTAVTVELHITDNSGDETVVSVPIDMAQLPVQ